MGQLVISAAGAAVAGALTGWNPTAMQAGWAIGGMLAPKPHQKASSQSLMDMRIIGTEYGQPIPYIRGAALTAGQMWWNTDRRATTTSTGGGGDGKGLGSATPESSSTTYDMDVLYGLTDNVIVGIARVWDNGKLIWTSDSGATAGSIAASAVAGQWDRMTVYTGAADQLPDPTYEAAVGAGNAPAYRGRGSVFIQGLKLGTSGQLRNLTFEVVVDGTVSESTSSVVYTIPATHEFESYTASYMTSYGPLWAPVRLKTDADGGYLNTWLIDLNTGSVVETFAWAANQGKVPLGMCYPGGDDADKLVTQQYNASAGTFNGDIYVLSGDGTSQYFNTGIGGGIGLVGLYQGSDNRFYGPLQTGSGPNGFYKFANVNYSAHTCVAADITAGPFSQVVLADNANGIDDRIYVRSYNGVGAIGFAFWRITATDWSAAFTVDAALLNVCMVGIDANIYVAFKDASDGHGYIAQYTAEGALVGSVDLGVYGTRVDGTMSLATDGTLYARLTDAGVSAKIYKVDTLSMTLESTRSAESEEVALVAARMISGAGVVMGDAATPLDAVRLIEALARVTIVPPTVASVVSGLCLRAGLSAAQFDVTALSTITRTVRCMPVTQIAATRGDLERLMAGYFFEITHSDKLYFRPRGGAAVVTIPYEDLGAVIGDDGEAEPLALRQMNELELPAQKALSYINIDDDYQSDTQMSDRLITAFSGSVEPVQMALGMTPSEAKSVVNTQLFDQAASVIGTQVALLGDYCRLEPTDVVIFTAKDGSTFRMRLVKRTDSYPALKFDAVLDDVSVLSSQGITDADYTPSTVVAPAVGTEMELLDIPILQDADSDAGFYVATKGDATPYPGSAVLQSADNVDYVLKVNVLESAVFGTCTTTLGDWTGARVFDEKNTVRVNVGDGALASSTRDAVLNSLAVNAMLVGSELIQFRTATLVSAGVYTLSGLLRGGRGTEWAMTGHAAAERCMLLRPAGLRRVVVENSELGVSRYYKGVTLGRPVSSATAESFTDNAVGLKPFSPFDLRARRDASNNITFTWQRRTRLSARTIGALGISVPLGEASEAYEIEIYADGTYATVLRTISVTAATASYTAAQQTTDGLTPGNRVYAKVYQLSARVGRGYTLEQAA